MKPIVLLMREHRLIEKMSKGVQVEDAVVMIILRAIENNEFCL